MVLCARIQCPLGTLEKLHSHRKPNICTEKLWKDVKMNLHCTFSEKSWKLLREEGCRLLHGITESDSHCRALHSCPPSHRCKNPAKWRSLTDTGMWESHHSGVHPGKNMQSTQSPDTRLSGLTAGIGRLRLYKV